MCVWNSLMWIWKYKYIHTHHDYLQYTQKPTRAQGDL